ncbi:MAG: PTS mannose transporter subunit IID [Selenomonadaceae bacterium]|nr:PTS mannose transporter subunit IID [Selenomonadaceae bacterium]
MFGIIVGTHGIFSSELVQSCEMICGKKDYVKAVTFVQGESTEKIAEKYQTAIKELGNPEKVLFLNDLRGGSPYNAACRLVKNNPKYGIVTGVNLPMLISMVYEDDADIKTLIEKAIFGGSEGMYPATYETLNAPEEILEGDE